MNRTVPEPDRGCRSTDGVGNSPCALLAHSRRGHVNRFLEERTVERLGLLEDRQHVQVALMHHAFEGEFAALDESFDQSPLMSRVPLTPDVGSAQYRAKSIEAFDKLVGAVRPHHSTAAGECEGFGSGRK